MTIHKVHPRARFKSIRAAYETRYYETARYIYFRSTTHPDTVLFRPRDSSHYEVAGVVEGGSESDDV